MSDRSTRRRDANQHLAQNIKKSQNLHSNWKKKTRHRQVHNLGRKSEHFSVYLIILKKLLQEPPEISLDLGFAPLHEQFSCLDYIMDQNIT